MKYLVIGLGNLGRAIAESLTRIGNEVIGVDINPHKTEAVKHTISGAIRHDGQRRLEHATTERDGCHLRHLRQGLRDLHTDCSPAKELRCEQTDRTRDFSHPRGSDPFDRCSGDHHSGR